MNIKPSDLVLEIGSGNSPNPRSDVLCDRYLTDDHERGGTIIIDRPMIIADGCRLPFRNKAFDYVICSHVLEHMKDPKAFVSEIMRVGKRGFIEMPSALSERIFGWNIHHWYCTKESHTLVFRKKTTGKQFGGFFHRLIAQTIWFRRFFEAYEQHMYVRHEWDTSVKIKIIHDKPSVSWESDLDTSAWLLLEKANPHVMKDAIFYILWMGRRVKRKIIKIFRNMSWNAQKKFQSHDILTRLLTTVCCLHCRGKEFSLSKRAVMCTKCHATYPMTQGIIPVLLSQEERKKGY